MTASATTRNTIARPRRLLLALAIASLCAACAGPRNLLSGYPPVNPDGTVNAVIEIPAGTLEKWEVDKSDGRLRHELRDGRPRVVDYLGYPGNYGMVPRTLLPTGDGGDGDPLDVLVLGASIPRGRVVPVVVVGVLRMLDSGERDDKLIAVGPGPSLRGVSSLERLESRYPGVTAIVETWFENYKGPGRVESLGFAGADEARAVIERAAADYGAGRNAAEDGD